MGRQTGTKTINNAFYEDLQDKWYEEKNHPVALLRAENQVRNPWIAEEIAKRFNKSCSILDIGCGAGLLTNYLSLQGHEVFGIDLSQTSLDIAAKKDITKKVQYQKADAYHLPFADQSFDCVCAMDVLEHVENPKKLIAEASRVLKNQGMFFFHTFNRNILSYLLIIKGVDLFVNNAPKNMHVYPLFIKPQELSAFCLAEDLLIDTFKGLRPKFNKALWRMVIKGNITDDFSFCFSNNLSTGYCGIATKINTKE